VVFPLEGLWWAGDMSAFTLGDRDQWMWTAMIAQPKYVTQDLFAAAVKEVERKKRLSLPGIRFESFSEGKAAQIMHIGPYSGEMATVDRMDAFAREKGYKLHGKHHEIYIGDPMRAQPEKLKTILRHPVLIES